MTKVETRAVKKMNDWRERLSLRTTPAGKGVFARRTFRKGQKIGEMRGNLIVDDDYDPDYVVDMGDAGVLEPKTPFRYLNHSCEPNCELVEWEDAATPGIYVHALRTVRPSQQLTIDYGWPAEAAIPCLCGTDSCRGWVVDEAQLSKAKRLHRRRRS